MPFALVAVVILAMSTATVAMVELGDDVGQDRESIDRMVGFADEVVTMTSPRLLALGSAACMAGDPDQEFDSLLSDINGTSTKGGMVADLDLSGVELMLATARVDGTSTMTTHYAVVGGFNVTVSCGDEWVRRHGSVGGAVWVPTPLIEGAMGSLEPDSMGSMVRSMLCALAEQRALDGFGSISAYGPEGTASLILEEDVMDALRLSIAIACTSAFHAVPSIDGVDPIIVETLSRDGALDPADLFLISKGATDVDVSGLVAQTIYADLDQLVMRSMEYLHLTDIVGAYERAGGLLVEGGNGLVEWLTGEDIALNDFLAHIEGEFVEHGYDENAYRLVNTGETDMVVDVPQRTIDTPDGNGGTVSVEVGGRAYIDFPHLDIVSSPEWATFLHSYLMDSEVMVETLYDSLERVSMAIGDSGRLGEVDVGVDPWDGMDHYDALSTTVDAAVSNGSMEGVLRDSVDGVRVVSSLDEAAYRFLIEDLDTIVDRRASVRTAVVQAAEQMTERAVEGSGLTDDAIDSLRSRVESMMRSDSEWGVSFAIEADLDRSVTEVVDRFEEVLIDGEVPSGDPLSWILGHLEDGDGVIDPVYRSIDGLLDGMADAHRVRCDSVVIPMHGSDGFEVSMGDDEHMTSLVPLVEPTWEDAIDVEVVMPWDREGSTHMTEPGSPSPCPHITLYGVRVEGAVDIGLSCDDTPSGDPITVSRTMLLDMDLDIPVFTAWGLEGTEYRDSSNLLSDVKEVLEMAWDGIMEVAGAVADGVSQILDMIGDALAKVLSYSVQAITALNDIVQSTVAELQALISSFVDGALGGVISFLVDNLETARFELELFGMRFWVETNPMDLALRVTRDLLRLGFSVDVGGSEASIILRLIKLGAGDFDVLVNATLDHGDWSTSLIVDPLMKVHDHLAQAKGHIGGLEYDLLMPQVVQYESFTVSLQDIPAIGTFLSSIPLPFPGLKGEFDAGFEVKYDMPFTSHMVINEYELNPPGPDSGSEWLELYNPSSEAIDLEGWTLTTSHGDIGDECLDGVVVASHSHHVIRFASQTLDNGRGDKSPMAESITLWDDQGRRVDSTPWASDYHNDDRTWQREHDASDRWTFKTSTMGTKNGKRSSDCSTFDWIEARIVDSVLRAMAEIGGAQPSVDSLASLLERAIDILIQDVIDLIADSIVELSMFVRAGVSDITSSASGGIGVSISIGSDFVKHGLEWVRDIVKECILSLGDATATTNHAHQASFLAEDVYVGLTVYGTMGVPRTISSLVDGSSFLFEASIRTNIAAIGSLLGEDWGQESVVISATLVGVPGGMLPRMFGVDCDKVADVHLIKAHLYP